MVARVEEVSTITAKGQTTVPKAVRKALGVDCGGKVAFRIDPDGVTIRRAEADDADPAIESFLAFLARDIQTRPEALASLDPDLFSRVTALTADADVDVDAAIVGPVVI